MTRSFGLTGLAVMGQNLARNVARHGFAVAVHNRTGARTREFLAAHSDEGDIVGAGTLGELVAALDRPRTVMVMVKAGAPVDAVVDGLAELLDDGDVIIDGGNSAFQDTERRAAAVAERRIGYLGTGVSGGEEGALNGPSIMPGGTPEAYEVARPVLTAISAQVDGTPCCTYLGPGGAGHYVKMVHNGIEYADMQLIAEAYDLLRTGLGMGNDQLADVFAEWDTGDLDSFLIEITARVLRVRDTDGGHLVDRVLDRAAQKGTGRLTAQQALELGVPVTAITEAVFARSLSALRDERLAAAQVLPGPSQVHVSGANGQRTAQDADGDPATFIVAVRDALYASKVVAYAQGFSQLRAASAEYGWDLDLGGIATIWRGGCIIRARFLDRIREAYAEHPDLDNLLLAPALTRAVAEGQDGWRRVVAEAARTGVPTPAFSSALSYYDGYRRERLPANLIQAQRDLFGAHTFERTDRDGAFHDLWRPPGA